MAWRALRIGQSNAPNPNPQNNPSGHLPSPAQPMDCSEAASATGNAVVAAAETAEQSAQTATAVSAIRIMEKMATSATPLPGGGGGTIPNSQHRQFYTSSAPHRPPIIHLSPLQLLNGISLTPNPQNLLRLETLIRLLYGEIHTLQVVLSSSSSSSSSSSAADGKKDPRYNSTLQELHRVFANRGRRTSSSSPRRGGEMGGDNTPSRKLHSWWMNSLSQLQRQQTALLLLQLYTETLTTLYDQGTAIGERASCQKRLEFERDLGAVVGHLRVLIPLL